MKWQLIYPAWKQRNSQRRQVRVVLASLSGRKWLSISVQWSVAGKPCCCSWSPFVSLPTDRLGPEVFAILWELAFTAHAQEVITRNTGQFRVISIKAAALIMRGLGEMDSIQVRHLFNRCAESSFYYTRPYSEFQRAHISFYRPDHAPTPPELQTPTGDLDFPS